MIKKETAQSIKTSRTRAKILSVATKLFRRYGYQNTSIRQICEEAKVSTGTFYHLFESKDAVVNAMLEEVNSYYNIDTDVNFEEDTPFIIADILIRNNLSMHQSMSPEVIFNAIFTPPGGNKTMFFEMRSNQAFLAAAIRGFQEAGKLRKDIPMEVMRQEIIACSFGTFYAVYTNEEVENYEIREKQLLYRVIATYLTEEEKAKNNKLAIGQVVL